MINPMGKKKRVAAINQSPDTVLNAGSVFKTNEEVECTSFKYVIFVHVSINRYILVHHHCAEYHGLSPFKS